MDISRQHDIVEIDKGLRSKDPLMRKVAGNARDNIRKQTDGWTKSARASLIRETLAGRTGNATQIRDDMVKHRGGRMGKGNKGEVISASIHWPEGLWEKIYGRRDVQN